jgi:hypothetical protein
MKEFFSVLYSRVFAYNTMRRRTNPINHALNMETLLANSKMEIQ